MANVSILIIKKIKQYMKVVYNMISGQHTSRMNRLKLLGSGI
jgi:hypothetical protein